MDAENWKHDPAKALGDNLFTIATAIPTGGAGASVKGLSKAGGLSRAAEASADASKAADAARWSDHLVSKERSNHILYGDEYGGGHLWPGKPGHSAFPKDWTEDRILYEISDVATKKGADWVRGTGPEDSDFTNAGAPAKFIVQGEKEGIRIEVVVAPRGKGIITGYPIGGLK